MAWQQGQQRLHGIQSQGIDAVRAAKIALDRGIGGPILSASSYFMKSPPVQHNDDAAHELVAAFIRGDIER